MGETAIRVLLVEDDPADVTLVREILQRAKIQNDLSLAQTGVEALDLLKGLIKSARHLLPNLIILDLNLPKRDGRWALSKIREVSELKQLPLIVWTTSTTSQDVNESYAHGANMFLTKPRDVAGIEEAVEAFRSFWTTAENFPMAKVFRRQTQALSFG